MKHIVLLGDSIFDNAAYVTPKPDVAQQLHARLGADWTITLLAVDGHVTADVKKRQLDLIPENASPLIVSVGGNDALRHAGILDAPATSVADAVSRLADAQSQFADEYAEMVDAVLELGVSTAICTIYDSNYPEPRHGLVVTGLALFNDVIARAAFGRRIPLIDLRLICSEAADYANPIEPSAIGGAKIAAVIAALVGGDGAAHPSTVWI